MKKSYFTLILSLFFCILSFQVFAQTFEYTSDEVENDFVLDEGNVNQDVVSHGFVTNMDPFTNNLYWVRTEVYMPQGWESAICDKTACYFPSVGEKALDLLASEQSIFDLHLYTYGLPGDSAVIQLCVYEVNDMSTQQCKTYVYRNEGLSSSKNIDDSEVSIKISPNPATDYFTIQSDTKIGRVDIYNIIGSKLKSFDSRDHAAFPVSELPSGMYLVRFFNEDNSRVVSTLRMKKR